MPKNDLEVKMGWCASKRRTRKYIFKRRFLCCPIRRERRFISVPCGWGIGWNRTDFVGPTVSQLVDSSYEPKNEPSHFCEQVVVNKQRRHREQNRLTSTFCKSESFKSHWMMAPKQLDDFANCHVLSSQHVTKNRVINVPLSIFPMLVPRWFKSQHSMFPQRKNKIEMPLSPCFSNRLLLNPSSVQKNILRYVSQWREPAFKNHQFLSISSKL